MDVRLFLSLEESLANRLVPKWHKTATWLTQQIVAALKKDDLHRVDQLIESVSTAGLYSGEAKYLKHISLSALLFGAAQVTGNAKSTMYAREKTAPTILTPAMRQLKIFMGEGDKAIKRELERTVQYALEAREQVKITKAAPLVKTMDEIIQQGADRAGERIINVTASLHTSRLSSYGFTVEAEVQGYDYYAINEQLDIRICPVCREMHGKVFPVAAAHDRLDRLLRVEDPADLKVLAPWPKQDQASVDRLKGMSPGDISAAGWDTPPYHPGCRGLLSRTDKVPDLEDFTRPVGVYPPPTEPANPYLPPVESAQRALNEIGDMKVLSQGTFKTESEFFETLFGMDKKGVQEKLSRLVEDSEIYMAVRGTTLRNKILAGDKRFKNSMETGTGSFKTIGEARAAKERSMFGIDADLDDFNRWPKYGFLSGKTMGNENMVGFGYGEVFVKFKKQNLRNRTTFTMGDSYNNNSFSPELTNVQGIAPASRLDAPSADTLKSLARVHPESANSKHLRGNHIDDWAKTTEYPEVQMYGDVTIDDVAEISTGSKKEALAIEKALKKAKLSEQVSVTPLSFDERIEYFTSYSPVALRHRHSLSRADLDRIGDEYIRKMNIASMVNSWIKNTRWTPPTDEMRSLLAKYKAAPEEFTAAEHRKITELVYARFDEEITGLPKFFTEDYRPKLRGWTEDIYNQELLSKGGITKSTEVVL